MLKLGREGGGEREQEAHPMSRSMLIVIDVLVVMLVLMLVVLVVLVVNVVVVVRRARLAL